MCIVAHYVSLYEEFMTSNQTFIIGKDRDVAPKLDWSDSINHYLKSAGVKNYVTKMCDELSAAARSSLGIIMLSHGRPSFVIHPPATPK